MERFFGIDIGGTNVKVGIVVPEYTRAAKGEQEQ